MSQKQYLKSIEIEIQRVNKIIDQKIIRGEDYWKEARDHKLLLRKVRFHARRSAGWRILRRLFPTFSLAF